MPFFDELQSRTAEARAALFAVPAIRECLAGRVTRRRYAAFPLRSSNRGLSSPSRRKTSC